MLLCLFQCDGRCHRAEQSSLTNPSVSLIWSNASRTSQIPFICVSLPHKMSSVICQKPGKHAPCFRYSTSGNLTYLQWNKGWVIGGIRCNLGNTCSLANFTVCSKNIMEWLKIDAVGLVGKAFSISMMSKWFSDLSWWKDIVHVLQEGFILDLIVSENKADAFALLSSSSVQALQVLHQVGGVVGTTEKHVLGMQISSLYSSGMLNIGLQTPGSLLVDKTLSKNLFYLFACRSTSKHLEHTNVLLNDHLKWKLWMIWNFL